MNLKKSSSLSFLKFFSFSLITISIIFLLIELIIRGFFSDFNYNAIYYEKGENHKVFKGKDTFLNKNEISERFVIRVEKKNEKFNFNKKEKIIFVGDSVTLGYGVDFKDNYIEKFKSKFNKDTQIIGFSNLNRDFNDIYFTINNEISKISKKNDTIVYQFNFNDIVEINNSNYLNNNSAEIIKDDFFKKFQKIKFKYLNHSSLIKMLNHHLSLITKNLKGSCEDRGINSLGQYSYSYFSKGYEDESQKSWSNFENKLIETKKFLDEKNINFFILITPISLQLNNHQSFNKLNFDINCSSKDGYKYLKNFLISNNIEIIDPTRRFQNSQQKNFKQLFHEFDTNHPNEYGHELISEEILKKFN